MIVDTTLLAGRSAYLRAASGAVNLGGEPRPATGRSAPIPDGHGVTVTGLSLLVGGDDLHGLLSRRDGPIIEIAVHKELFPDLWIDPYAARVHAIAGSEDLRGGQLKGGRILEFEGQPTLVSTGRGRCSWRSEVFTVAEAVTFSAAAWSLVDTRMADGFTYKLILRAWGSGAAPASPTFEIALVQGDDPRAPRAAPSIAGGSLEDVTAYQVEFVAEVLSEGEFAERLSGREGSVGRPLFQGVHLVEPVDSIYSFHSLHEVAARATAGGFLEGTDGRAFTASLPLGASLVEGEEIAVTLHTDAITSFEARLQAAVEVRPPRGARTAE